MILKNLSFLTLYIFIVNQSIQAQPEPEYQPKPPMDLIYGQLYPGYLKPFIYIPQGDDLKPLIDATDQIHTETYKRTAGESSVIISSCWFGDKKNNHLETVAKNIGVNINLANKYEICCALIPTNILEHNNNTKEHYKAYKDAKEQYKAYKKLTNEIRKKDNKAIKRERDEKKNITACMVMSAIDNLWSSLAEAVTSNSTPIN